MGYPVRGRCAVEECYILRRDDRSLCSLGARVSQRREEQEEAYARATVALTRAQKLCIIMGPLDMRGLLRPATVIGRLKYGAGACGVHVDNPSAEVFMKERTLNAGPDDSAFLTSLRWSLNTPRGARKFTAKTSIP